MKDQSAMHQVDPNTLEATGKNSHRFWKDSVMTWGCLCMGVSENSGVKNPQNHPF